MTQTDTFFQQRDKRRWLTDRFARSVITLGGGSVLVTLLLLIFYLVVVITPIFSGASMTRHADFSLATNNASNQQPIALGIDDDGKTAYHFTQDGWLIFSALPSRTHQGALSSPLSTQPILQAQVVAEPLVFKAAETSSRWYGYSDHSGFIYAVHPKFSSVYTQSGEHAAPSLGTFAQNPIPLDEQGVPIVQFDFSIQPQQATFVGVNQQGQWQALRYQKKYNHLENRVFREPATKAQWQLLRLQIPQINQMVKDFIVTPDGNTLYLLHPHSLSVLKRDGMAFSLRETVALSSSKLGLSGIDNKGDSKAGKATNQSQAEGVTLNLLPGAYSVLVTESDGQVSQWFDVLKEGERHFTRIRDFVKSRELVKHDSLVKNGAPVKNDSLVKKQHAQTGFLLPDFYRKGFFRFDDSGRVDNYFTTADNKVLSKKIATQAPVAAASSANENFLLTAYGDRWSLFGVNNPHPDISFHSLWQKVWYEGYPEPEFIWQSTSAANDFEPKFSLVPIAFGTLKSALFAMLFAVPISICGAIYTAYFMTAKMRRYVKPTIELMEALPTVIIGFLAGLWLAPIVELNLLNTLLFIVLLPLVFLVSAFVWHLLNRKLEGEFQGWVALMLIPIVLGFGLLISMYGHQLEAWLFGGDVRFYLAKLGINFDQRNALIVGFAMGFAVIPTIFTIAEDAIFSVPKHLSDGASALGATPWQCLTTVVLVTASPGIFSAVMMGLGRAVGETMIVLMATGNTPIMDWNIFEGMRTLSANIAIEMPESEVGSSHFRLLFLSAFLLFVFTFIVNSIAEYIRQRLRDKYSAL